jgi:hypothetical protein
MQLFADLEPSAEVTSFLFTAASVIGSVAETGNAVSRFFLVVQMVKKFPAFFFFFGTRNFITMPTRGDPWILY